MAYDCDLCTCIPNVLQSFQIHLLSWLHNIFNITTDVHIQSLGEITTFCFCWSTALLSLLIPFQSIHWQIHAVFSQKHKSIALLISILPRYNKSNSTLQNPSSSTRVPFNRHFFKHSNGLLLSNSICTIRLHFLKLWVIQNCLMLYIRNSL